MDTTLRKRVEANLFPGARAAVEPWDKFNWHPNPSQCDTWCRHSSQALAIGFFGTLKDSPQPERDAVLRNVSERLQLPDAGPWRVELEWEDPVVP